ncbi:hypothetical protein SGRA_2926 [Saprospira grandis str. Lewin]|uniref:Uncharacterized protein n=1 Tax=Saprospira grandis (strain Lewin) TaxID=984262 RepID=H6LAR1_SAPGL|nr:hypothetical protein SGRA_2926 [Saprospira grandis str. Lewin]
MNNKIRLKDKKGGAALGPKAKKKRKNPEVFPLF